MFHVQQSGEPRALGEPIPTFTSLAERNAAEATGQYPPMFVWQRTQGGTVVETGYIDLAGVWHSTGDASTEVADYAAAVALPSPQDGDQVTLLDQIQRHASGDLVYRASVPGGPIGWWLPKSVANLDDFAFQNAVPTSIKTVAADGTDDYASLTASEWIDFSTGPGGAVTDVTDALQFYGNTARAGLQLNALTSTLDVGTKILILIRANVTIFNAAAGNTASRCNTHDGEHNHSISFTRGGINEFGFINNAGTTLSSGIDMSSQRRMIALYEIGAGGSLITRGWSPDSGWTGPSMVETEGGFDTGANTNFGFSTDASNHGQQFLLSEAHMILLET